ncbi:MAG: hypothetical protein LC647_02715 [Beggiatoa sp.]|nr:hypothetical protein [Beggiatoa sp.]
MNRLPCPIRPVLSRRGPEPGFRFQGYSKTSLEIDADPAARLGRRDLAEATIGGHVRGIQLQRRHRVIGTLQALLFDGPAGDRIDVGLETGRGARSRPLVPAPARGREER